MILSVINEICNCLIYVINIALFGSKTAKAEIEKTKQEIKRREMEIAKEQIEKVKIEQDQYEKEIASFLSSDDDPLLSILSSHLSGEGRTEGRPTGIIFQFSMQVSEMRYAISKGKPFFQSNKLCELSIKGLHINSSYSNQKLDITFRLKNLELKDGICEKPGFGKLIQSMKWYNLRKSSEGTEVGARKASSDEELALKIKFSHDLLHPAANLNLTITSTHRFLLCLNYLTISAIVQEAAINFFSLNLNIASFKPYIGSAQDFCKKIFSFCRSLANNAQKMYFELSPHFAINLFLRLPAPIIFIPLNSLVSRACLVANLGEIIIESVVKRKDTNRNYINESDVSILYDYYEIKINKFSLYKSNDIQQELEYLSDMPGDLEKIPANYYRYVFVRESDIQCRIYHCLEREHPKVPLYKFGLIMNKITIIMTDQNINFLFALIENICSNIITLNNSISWEALWKYKNELSIMCDDIVMQSLESAGSRSRRSSRADSISEPLSANLVTSMSLISDILKEESKMKSVMMPEQAQKSAFAFEEKPYYEIMMHFDEVSITFGRIITSEEVLFGNFVKKKLVKHPHEVPFHKDLRFGINGVFFNLNLSSIGNFYILMRIYQMYIRDMQIVAVQTENSTSAEKVTYKRRLPLNYQYLLKIAEESTQQENTSSSSSSKSEPSYRAFLNNAMFFKRLEISIPYMESTKLISVSYSGNLTNPDKSVAGTIAFTNIILVLPKYSLASAVLYLHMIWNHIRNLAHIRENGEALDSSLLKEIISTQEKVAFDISDFLHFARLFPKYEGQFSQKISFEKIQFYLPINVIYRYL